MVPMGVRTIVLVAGGLMLAATGCASGGPPGGVEGVTAYHAANLARDAMDDEVTKKGSLAFDRTWIIDDTTAEQLDDGTWAWRVTFVELGATSNTLCIWGQLEKRYLGGSARERSYTREQFGYFLDRCPTAGAGY